MPPFFSHKFLFTHVFLQSGYILYIYMGFSFKEKRHLRKKRIHLEKMYSRSCPVKKYLSLASIAFLVAACGDTVENVNQINQMGMLVADSEDDLPKCNKDNEGEQAVVKGESVVRVCIDGDWEAMDGAGAGGFSCKTEELKDKSGLKIVCNGDSIGVVYNGSDGKAGKDGKNGADGEDGKNGEDGVSGSGCSITDRNDTAVVVVCGDSTMTIDLSFGLPNDTAEADSERTAISLDSVAGFTQKGPFLKGSTVYLYELSDGRTLKQTNGNFTSKITSDDGHYKFSARDLVSQYAMVIVDGYYRNEVTGEASDAPIRLSALTDMRKRSSVNVNLLTNMEFDRVYYLVTREKMTVKQAKRQAQREILKQFHIELDSNTDAEDMDVFGSTDADAALLAVSVLLQGDSNATALSVLLTEISNAIAENGEWNNDSTKARLADWALVADLGGAKSRLDSFRTNVSDWHLSETVPEYEKFVRRFVGIETGMGVCGSDSVQAGVVKNVSNRFARTYYASDYSDVENSKVRFICKEKGGLKNWQVATDIEKDTMSLGHKHAEGLVKKGLVNANLSYVYEDGNWRHGTENDGVVNVGCIQARKDTVAKGSNGTWYKCIGDSTMNLEESQWTSAWRTANNIEKDTATWGKDYAEGTVKKGQVNSLFYVFEGGNWRHGTTIDGYVNVGCTQARKDTVAKGSTGYWYKCIGDSALAYTLSGIRESEWTSAWRTANNIEKDTATWGNDYAEGTVKKGQVNTGLSYVFEGGNWRHGTTFDGYVNVGCIQARKDTVAQGSNGVWYKCKGDTTMSYTSNNVRESAWTSAWRTASNIEKDTATWGHSYSEGTVKNGKVNTTLTYVYQNNNWRLGSEIDSLTNRGCVPSRQDTVAYATNKGWYICKSNSWRLATDIEKDTATWGHSYSEGSVKNGKVNTTLTYVYQNNNWRLGTEIDSLTKRGCVPSRQDTVAYATNKGWYICKSNSWRLATDIEKDTATWGRGNDGQIKAGRVTGTKYIYDSVQVAWRLPTTVESVLGGCTVARAKSYSTNTGRVSGQWYICKNRTWSTTTVITVDTQGWSSSTDGKIKKGDSTNTFYKYDQYLQAWNYATQNDTTLGLPYGCTYNHQSYVEQGKNSSYYVCKYSNSLYDWSTATDIDRETSRHRCTSSNIGEVLSGVLTSTNKYYCKSSGWVSMMGGWNASFPKEARLNQSYSYGTMTDSRDNQVYKTTKIGTQTWMAENLNYRYLGASLYEDSTSFVSPNYGRITGRLYYWSAAIDSARLQKEKGMVCGLGKTCTLPSKWQGVCPSGWHLPTKAEFETLVSYVGESKAGLALKTQTGWDTKNSSGLGLNGTDAYGFSAMPSGNYNGSVYNTGTWYTGALFYSATEDTEYRSYYLSIGWKSETVGVNAGYYSYNKNEAYSVRCIKN